MQDHQGYEAVLAASDTQVAQFEGGKTRLQRIQHFLHSTPAAVPLIVLVMALIAFAVSIDGKAMLYQLGLYDGFAALGVVEPLAEGQALNLKFFAGTTLTLILQQITIVGMLGAAQTLVVLTAGIDLSVGVIMVFSGVIMGNCLLAYGFPAPLAIVMGLLVGTLYGALNGVLVAYFRLPPFIVTLGTWNIVAATNYIYSANETLREADLEAATGTFKIGDFDLEVGWIHLFGFDFKIGSAVFTIGVITMVVLAFLLWYVLNYTAWGRHVYAVGDDPEAAQLAGIRVNRVLIAVYAIAGFIAALTAWVAAGRTGSISPSAAVTDYNLQAITAAVIGGISLFGGRGSILGTLFGALIVGVTSMGLNMLGADPQWKVLLTGVLIIGAVGIDQWIRRVAG
jgi:fructose transport system permease protein